MSLSRRHRRQSAASRWPWLLRAHRAVGRVGRRRSATRRRTSPSPSRRRAKIGDTPADFAEAPPWPPVRPEGAATRQPTSPAPAARRSISGPRTIQVVRPERTVVRDVDQTLPIALSGAALLLAVGGVGIVLVRTRAARRSIAH